MAADIFCCNGDPERKRASDISKQIDEQIKREKIQFRRTVKILLLGAGESGKSTFLKQMRIIHGEDFDTKTLMEFRDTIYSNVVKGMRVLIDARGKLKIPWGDEANAKHAQFVFNYDNSKLDETVFQSYVEPLEKLWQDSGILTAFDRRKEFQLVSISFYNKTALITCFINLVLGKMIPSKWLDPNSPILTIKIEKYTRLTHEKNRLTRLVDKSGHMSQSVQKH